MGIVEEVLEVLGQLRPAVVYFLGENDTGKTALIIRLANQLLGTSVAILDADIGQSSVLPLTISLLRAERPFSAFSELPIVGQDFIPGYNLVRNLERNARTMGELAKEARAWAEYCLVDTTGFVGGPGIRLKRREMEEIRPDLVVALHHSHELRPIFKGLKCRSLLFPVPSWMGKKSESERRKRRNQRLSSYFQGSSLREIPARAAACIPVSPKERIVGLYGERFLGLGVAMGVRDEKLLVLTPVKRDLRRVEFTPVRFGPGESHGEEDWGYRAVGPRMGEGNEDEKMRNATLNSLRLADEHRLRSIASPAISTGIFGFPTDRCAHIMLSTAIDYVKGHTGLERIIFCLYGTEAFQVFTRKLESLSG